jgi:hypothetical protein
MSEFNNGDLVAWNGVIGSYRALRHCIQVGDFVRKANPDEIVAYIRINF